MKQTLLLVAIATFLQQTQFSETWADEALVTYDHSRLADSRHMLEWLHPKPIDEVYATFSDYVEEMLPGSEVVSLSVDSDPQWLTGGRPHTDDPSNVVLTRAGVAFLFTLRVKPPHSREETVSGVFTWVGVQLDDLPNSKERVWIDVGGTLEKYGSDGELNVRIYTPQTDPSSPTNEAPNQQRHADQPSAGR